MVSGASVDEGLVASSPLATEIHHTGSGPIAASADEADQDVREERKKESRENGGWERIGLRLGDGWHVTMTM